MNVEIKILNSRSKLPYKKYDEDFCYDVYATGIKDYGDGRIEYTTGIALQCQEIPYNQRISFDFRCRSSIHETGLLLSNCIGTIDQGHTGEIKAIFYNVIKELANYKVGERIGQICLSKTEPLSFKIVSNFSNKTKRGDNGYGHTGR